MNSVIDQELDSLPKTRKEAMKIGSINYFTGRPCKNGHIAERNTKSAKCCECRREYRRRHYHEIAESDSVLFFRKCPRCNKELEYRSKQGLDNADKKNGMCSKCHNYIRFKKKYTNTHDEQID